MKFLEDERRKERVDEPTVRDKLEPNPTIVLNVSKWIKNQLIENYWKINSFLKVNSYKTENPNEEIQTGSSSYPR